MTAVTSPTAWSRFEWVHRCFVGHGPARAARIGVELEWIPTIHGRAAPWAAGPGATLPWMRALARQRRWRESSTSKGVPRFVAPGAGAITFEPGGQIEFSAPPLRSLSRVLSRMRHAHEVLAEAAGAAGVTLLSAGLDPSTPPELAALSLPAERYRAMDRYFDTLGPAGRRMMRQTAALQINLDPGPAPFARWDLLNAISPYLLAMFANSPRYAGRDTGHRSFRGSTWRAVDRRRTGLPWDPVDPAGAYLDFALRAPALVPFGGEDYRPFSEWSGIGLDTPRAWDTHLSTLFPEVRPRGYFEIRSLDAVPPAWHAAALVLVAGIVLDDRAAGASRELLGEPDPVLLTAAGQQGLSHPVIRARVNDLVDLALAGARRLGVSVLEDVDIERAEAALRICCGGIDPGAASRSVPDPGRA